jgi:hypothetical protein
VEVNLTVAQKNLLASMPINGEIAMGGTDAPIVVWLQKLGLVEHVGCWRYRITAAGREALKQ